MIVFNTPIERMILAYYGSLMEISETALKVHRAGSWVGLPTLVRAMMEVLADIRLLVRDPNYIDCIKLKHANFWIKRFEAADEGNPLLSSVKNSPDKDFYEQEAKELRDKGVVMLTIKERFDRADMQQAYEGSYALLSSDTHVDLSAIAGNPFNLQNRTLKVSYFREYEGSEKLATMFTWLEIVFLAVEEIAKVFTGFEKQIEDYDTIVQELDDAASTTLSA